MVRGVMKMLLGSLLLSALLSGCGPFGDTAIESAYNNCDESEDLDASAFEVADDGNSLIVDTKDDYSGLACLLRELDTPRALMADMDATTAMMGRQTEEANGLRYAWSYHPDTGINMTIQKD